MAASTTVFSTTPISGVSLSSKASSPSLPRLTRVSGNDGHVYLAVRASETIGSITTCIIGVDGSASSDAGSAGWTANVPGGAAAGQTFWVKRTTLA